VIRPRFAAALRTLAVLAALALLHVPEALEAQGRTGRQRARDQRERLDERWRYTLALGSFRYDPADDRFVSVGLRADFPLSEYLQFEAHLQGVRPEFLPEVGTNRVSATLIVFELGIQWRYRLGPLEPYTGVSGGLFARRDSDSDGRRFTRSTVSFPLGLRVDVSDNLTLMGEYRIRRDGHEIFTVTDTDLLVGVGLRF